MPYARIHINKGAICLRLSSFFYTFATDLGTYAHRPVHLQGGRASITIDYKLKRIHISHEKNAICDAGPSGQREYVGSHDLG